MRNVGTTRPTQSSKIVDKEAFCAGETSGTVLTGDTIAD